MNTELNNTPCLNDNVLVSTVVSLDSVSSETKRVKIEGDLAAQGCMMISISTWLQRGLHMADLESGYPAAIARGNKRSQRKNFPGGSHTRRSVQIRSDQIDPGALWSNHAEELLRSKIGQIEICSGPIVVHKSSIVDQKNHA